MNIRPCLSTVDFVHLKCRKRCCLVLCQVERLARRERMRPITRTDIVFCPGLEAAGGGKESVDRPKGDLLRFPSQNEWLIVRVRKSANVTNRPGDISS